MINYFNDIFDNGIMDSEGNSCVIIAIPSIESNFDNYHIHVFHDIPKRYIHGYLISNLISSEATIQNTILQNICLILIWGDAKEIKEIKKTCSNPRQTFFLHTLLFECTSKLCGTFLNQILYYFHIKKCMTQFND